MTIELAIALYGAILATILGIRELTNERRKVTIILQYITFYDRAQIIVTNSGHRAITLTGLAMETEIAGEHGKHWETVPQNALFDLESGKAPFPVTIDDGESVTLPLGIVVTEYLSKNKLSANLEIFDSEGHSYTKHKINIYDGKWGGYYY